MIFHTQFLAVTLFRVVKYSELFLWHNIVECPKQICFQYLKKLHLNKKYFNTRHNKCYCSICYKPSEPKVLPVVNPKYTVPIDWVSFGIQVDKAFASNNQIFKKWYTTFYGTSKDKLNDIIHNRFIPFPGDDLLSGRKFTLNLPDQHHIYTSPSINYSSLDHVSPADKVDINNQWYDFQVVLQCKQNPAYIEKKSSGKPNVCNLLPDAKIQWKTDQRSSVVPCSLLIRATKRSTV
ncbi:unnamed protein product [Rotaria sp. Silwood2]|nr:unnamed protein product [Rotaria sp. Silwood2]CAF4163246.1 unnamed protein product [Rotaria sp. Silwood2]